MTSVWEEYNTRCVEINLYFDFLKNEIEQNTNNTDLIKMHKASSIIMLYNLVESTVRNAVIEIHDSINSQGVPYKNLSKEAQAIWIEFKYNKFKEKKSKDIASQITTILEDIFDVDYERYTKKNKSAGFSGNLDAKKIRESVCNKYGLNHNQRVQDNNGQLLKIKSLRNNISHGNKSYTDAGRNLGENDLKKLRKTTILYLREFLLIVEDFISDKKYITNN